MRTDYYDVAKTKLANQRTYLAHVRTGFVCAGVASIFKKPLFFLIALIMILGSTLQYYLIYTHLNNKKTISNDLFDRITMLYVLISLGVLLLDFNKSFKK